MATVVVPFRSTDPKSRLDGISGDARVALAHAMLADVLAAATPVGRVLVVAPDPPGLPAGATHVARSAARSGSRRARRARRSRRRGAAGAVPRRQRRPALRRHARPARAGRSGARTAGSRSPPHADGTTNALALSDELLFEPLYGPGSAERFAALGPSLRLDAPNLIDDVDTLDDLARLRERLGAHTRRVLAALDLPFAA